MKKAKLISSLALIAMMVSMFTMFAFADGSLPDHVDYGSVEGDSAETAKIPVYGYLGEDVNIDPGTGDDEPDVKPYEVNVSVPTKFIWAAFETDDGAISSPVYHIRNNARVEGNDHSRDLNVRMFKFEREAVNPSNDEIDKYLRLLLSKADSNTFNGPDISLISGNGTNASYGSSTPIGSAKLGANSQWDFKLTGTYDSKIGRGFDKAYTPKYTLTFEFSIN
ncbi:MAG: hypothetical protein LBK04_07700 [Clostridiales Family XIII bacterium]|jgi:hypothetical protein|nr:hypothetical protein [Clostridiales Family XIII bacterium]